MKNVKQFLTILTILIATSCAEHDVLFTGENGDINKWIYEAMQDVYYWNNDMPDIKTLNCSLAPEAFFYTLLSSKDGKTYQDEYNQNVRYYYSYITKKEGVTKAYQGDEISFGFEFQTYYDENLNYGCKILYVLPDSPASEAELKRGDFIVAINGQRVTKELSSTLRTLSYAELSIAETIDGEPVRTVELEARNIEDKPLFVNKTIVHNGKKVAYMAYNHFAHQKYDAYLKSAFTQLAAERPDEFILDLRYNNGGLISSANVLASLLVPQAHKNDLFYYIDYNDNLNQKYSQSEERFDSSLTGLHYLDRIYIITGTRTASASELVIAGLQPYMDVIIIGETTEGKNVGSTTYRSGNYDWQLQPIICNVKTNNHIDYSGGIPPTYECKEPRGYWGQLGDTDEYLLEQALNHISTNNIKSVSASLTKAENSTQLTEVYNSLDRKKTNGVVISEIDFH